MGLYPFKQGARILISGPSESGKTRICKKLIDNRGSMFFGGGPEKILFSYRHFQPDYHELQRQHPDIVFTKGVPSREDVKALTGLSSLDEFRSEQNPDPQNRPHLMICIDDNISAVVNDSFMEELITGYSHHLNLTTVILSQNIFYQGKKSVTLMQNFNYYVFTGSMRVMSKLQTFGLQIFGNNKRRKGFLEAFDYICKKKYGYLVLDVSSGSRPMHMLRSNIFPQEDPTEIFSLKY